MVTRRIGDSKATVYKGRRKRKRFTRRMTTGKVKAIIERENNKNVEIKSIDLERQSDTVVNSGTFVLLSDLTQGTQANQFIGNETTPKYLGFRCTITGNATNALDQRYRIILLQNKVDAAVALTSNDILQNPLDAYSFYERGKYVAKILADVRGVVSHNVTNSDNIQYHEFLIPGKAMGKTHNIGSTEHRNAIYVFFMSSVVSNPPTLNWSSRFAYTDQ